MLPTPKGAADPDPMRIVRLRPYRAGFGQTLTIALYDPDAEAGRAQGPHHYPVPFRAVLRDAAKGGRVVAVICDVLGLAAGHASDGPEAVRSIVAFLTCGTCGEESATWTAWHAAIDGDAFSCECANRFGES